MGIKENSVITRKEKKADKKKYKVGNHHVHITNMNVPENVNECVEEENKEIQDNKNKSEGEQANFSDSENSASAMCGKDIMELRTVYNKCKAIMKKMERKYGHLLQLDDKKSCETRKRKLGSVECNCTVKRKIIYDDNGMEIFQNVDEHHHICPKNIQKPFNNLHTNSETLHVNIENETAYELPDDINELTKLSREPNISKYIQYQVIQKIKNIYNERHNLMRFEKHTLIEKAKSNCNEIFEFNGSNLTSLPGYPVDKIT